MSRSEPFYSRWWRWLTQGEAPPPKVVSDGERVLLDSETAGDEPYMLARNLPGVVVLVDKNRVKAGQYAIKKFGSDILLLDDGFQYLPLRGQYNLLLVDKTNPFGNKCLYPRGILREPVSHLRRASIVFVTKSDGVLDPELLATIRRHKPGAEIIECAHRPKHLQSVDSGETRPLEELRGRKIAALSGIATPESFEQLLRDLGAEIRHNKRFLDHHRFTTEDIERFYAQAAAAEAELIVMTEKDAVRLPLGVKAPAPVVYLRLEIEILSGDRDFEAAVSRICFPRSTIRQTRSPFVTEPEVYAEE
jgi:tetraacyldisaccharide 4'-kinase